MLFRFAASRCGARASVYAWAGSPIEAVLLPVLLSGAYRTRVSASLDRQQDCLSYEMRLECAVSNGTQECVRHENYLVEVGGGVMKRKKNQAGVTLIEMLVVVMIIGLFAALVVPKMLQKGDAARVTA